MSAIKTTQIDGDISVGRNVTLGGRVRIAGSVIIGHNLKIDGWLEAPNIIGPLKGIYESEDDLRARYPRPRDGWMAFVGQSTPFACFVSRDGDWVSTGCNVDVTVNMSRFEEDLSRLHDDVNGMESAIRSNTEMLSSHREELYHLADLINGVSAVAESGKSAGDSNKKSIEQNTSDIATLRDVIRGIGPQSSAYLYPFIDLGNVKTQCDVNALLDAAYVSNDLKYNGRLRLKRNGALIEVSQHVVKSVQGEPFHWAQAVLGMLVPSEDGSELDAGNELNLCVRWTDYQGRSTGWKKYGGGEGEVSLKTINGKSLKGEGNIEITAEGQITVDDVVSETSGNAVSSRAVARALAELATSIPDLDGVTADMAALTGRVAATENLAAELDGRVALVEQAAQGVRECVGTFAGSVSSATVRDGSYSGSDGEVMFVEHTGMASAPSMFALRVLQGTAFVYYSNWPQNSAYKDLEKGMGPREDALYIDTTTDKLYLYDSATKALKEIQGDGGSVTPADQQLDPNSTAAVSNQAVTRAINVINNEIATIRTEGLPSKVQADEQTISAKNADGTTAAVHLADLALQERDAATQQLVTVREVGTVHHTSQEAPATVKGNTAYKLYKTLTSGNDTVDGKPAIQMAAGSKLVPAGGVPGKEGDEQIAVEGGELSWVHSSDIGMIQDGQLPTGMTRAQVGAHNADVLRMVAASRWNLILDGTYYVNVGRAAGTTDVVSGDGGRRNARLNAVIVSRPLRIRGGGLIAERYLFCVEPGGGLVMEDVMLDNLSNYQMIYVDADGALVDSVELYRCSLKTSASPTGTDKYAKNGRFIGGKARNAGNVDTVNDLMPNGLSRQFNATNCKTILGMSDNEGGLRSRFGQKSATATEPSQLLVYPLGQAFPGDSESSRSAAECAYDMWSQLYVPQAGGGYVFKERSGSTTKHFGMYGDFVPTPDNLTGVYKENGEVVYYEPMYVHDTYENGALVRGANPEVEHNGLRRLIIEDCTVMCQSTAIELGGMEVTDEFRIHGCRFYNILALAVNFGTSNDMEAADDWASRSCPLEVSGNTFKGPGEMNVPSSSTTYACAILYEGDKVVFADNVIEDIVTTTTTYDCYLSCNNLEYRGNVIRNVLNWKNGKKLYGYMKAKKEKINAVYRARWRDTPAAHPMKLSRVYEGNRYEVNLKDVRRLCDWYMEENRASLLPDYQDTAWDEVPQEAKDGVLREKVLKTMFDNIVSTWAFDSYVIRDNVFDWPDCRVDGAGLSGGQARVRRWVFSGNVLKGLSFCNTQADGYDKYLFAIQCLDEGTDVEIVGNRFESNGHEVINLLCANDQKALDSLRVEDNTFVECGYRIAQKGRLQGGTYYDGVLVAGKVRIRGNEEAVGLDRGFTGPYYYDATQYFAQKGLPVMYCGLGGEDDITEVWDSQAAGVAAQTGKMVLLPVGKGRFALHSRHLCRPMQKDGDGIPVLAGDCSLSLINSFMLRNSNGTIAPDSKGYAINISYCVRGRWRERKMELRCVPYESALRGVSVRGVDGVRWVHSRTYPGSGNPSYNKVYYTDLAPVEDLGLHFLLSHRSIVATNKNYTNNGAPMIRLALYTDAGGTLNDPGTVITIRVSDIAANVDMPASGNGVAYGATSPFETFLPKGSALTSAERTALKTADYCLYKAEPDESQGARSSTLLAGDAGWWCVDPGSGQIVTWTGSKWSDEPVEESE